MLHVTRIQDAWLAIGASLILSTLIAVAVTAGTMVVLGRLSGDGETGGEDR